MFKKRFLLPAVIVLALSLTACGSDDVEPENTTPPAEVQEEITVDEPIEETPVEDGSAVEYSQIIVTPGEAFDIYMEKYPAAKVQSIQIDKKMGNYIYQIEGFEGNTEYEIYLDPIDGSITKEQTETDIELDRMEITRENVDKIMAMVDQALVEAGEGAQLEEWTFEMDDGRAELDIDIDKKGFDNVERTYDVETGELLEIED